MNRREFLTGATASLSAASAITWRPRQTCGQAQTTPPASQSPDAGGLISGSFIFVFHPNVWDMAYCDEALFWQEENWRAMIRDMHNVGMDTCIWANSAFWGRPLFPGHEKKVGRPLKMGCADPMGVCADEADRLGMKIFYAVGLRGRVSQVRDYATMEKPWPDVWFQWNTNLAEALVQRYGSRPSFQGLYIAYEMDFDDHEIELYEKLIRHHLRPVIGDTKLLASPGNIGHLAENPDKLIKKVQRTGFDVLAPQDYGGRSRDVEKALELVRNNARGLERVAGPLRDIGVTLWSNCETFVLQPTPDGRRACMPGPIERIKQQIEIQSPLVQKLITWIYQGVMNRRTDLVNVGHPSTDALYQQYVEYLKGKFPGRLPTTCGRSTFPIRDSSKTND